MGSGSQVHSSPDFEHSPPPRVQGIPTPFSFGVGGGQPGGRSTAKSNTVASVGGGGADDPEWHPAASVNPSHQSRASLMPAGYPYPAFN